MLARKEFVVDDRVNVDGTCLYVKCKYMVIYMVIYIAICIHKIKNLKLIILLKFGCLEHPMLLQSPCGTGNYSISLR